METFSSGTVKFLRKGQRNFKSGFGSCFDRFAFENKYFTLKCIHYR